MIRYAEFTCRGSVTGVADSRSTAKYCTRHPVLQTGHKKESHWGAHKSKIMASKFDDQGRQQGEI
jgi:hypothetical protein